MYAYLMYTYLKYLTFQSRRVYIMNNFKTLKIYMIDPACCAVRPKEREKRKESQPWQGRDMAMKVQSGKKVVILKNCMSHQPLHASSL